MAGYVRTSSCPGPADLIAGNKVHFLTSIESVAKGLADCVKQGLTKAVGVSNYSKEHMIRMYEGQSLHGLGCPSLTRLHFMGSPEKGGNTM